MTYYGICSCEWRGRLFKNPNDADTACEDHAYRGRRGLAGLDRSGRNHVTKVVEWKKGWR